jgi:TetR/AcrR family fatty acid metabolism transcriptional regulator
MVMPQSSRRERKKVETRERILSAGLAAFADRGIDNCTIDEIALAADVGKGTVYNYFRTKEDLVVSFMVEVERQAQDAAAKLVQGNRSPQSILTRFIEFQFKLKEPHYPFVRVFLAQLAGKARPDAEWVRQASEALDPPLTQLFTAMQTRGRVRTDVDVTTLVGAFKVMQLGLTVLWALEGPPWSGTTKAIQQQVQLFCSGIEVKR